MDHFGHAVDVLGCEAAGLLFPEGMARSAARSAVGVGAPRSRSQGRPSRRRSRGFPCGRCLGLSGGLDGPSNDVGLCNSLHAKQEQLWAVRGDRCRSGRRTASTWITVRCWLTGSGARPAPGRRREPDVPNRFARSLCGGIYVRRNATDASRCPRATARHAPHSRRCPPPRAPPPRSQSTGDRTPRRPESERCVRSGRNLPAPKASSAPTGARRASPAPTDGGRRPKRSSSRVSGSRPPSPSGPCSATHSL